MRATIPARTSPPTIQRVPTVMHIGYPTGQATNAGFKACSVIARRRRARFRSWARGPGAGTTHQADVTQVGSGSFVGKGLWAYKFHDQDLE
jgi:hypothetical protein